MRAISPRCQPASKGAGFLFVAPGAYAPELRSSHIASISCPPLKGPSYWFVLWSFPGFAPKGSSYSLHSSYPLWYRSSPGPVYTFSLLHHLTLQCLHNTLLPKSADCRICILDSHAGQTSSANFSLLDIPWTMTRSVSVECLPAYERDLAWDVLLLSPLLCMCTDHEESLQIFLVLIVYYFTPILRGEDYRVPTQPFCMCWTSSLRHEITFPFSIVAWTPLLYRKVISLLNPLLVTRIAGGFLFRMDIFASKNISCSTD